MDRLLIRKQKFFLAVFITVIFIIPSISHGSKLDNLRDAVQQKNEKIKKLEEEAKKYKEEIETSQEKAKTLSAEIARIRNEISKINKDIAINQSNIEKTKLEIDVITIEIDLKENKIDKFRKSLASLIQVFFEQKQVPLLTTFFKNSFLSDFLIRLNNLERLQDKILLSVQTLRSLREELKIKKAEAEEKQADLKNLDRLLEIRNEAKESQKKEQNILLNETKNQEKKYQQLLEEREKKRLLLEEEVRDIELQIQIAIDPQTLPARGVKILGYPLPNTILESCWNGEKKKDDNCITQYFGYTSFARAGGYGGKNGHNGADFRADIGTPVLAAAGGIIEATGDTDIGCKGASYGKWVLIQHSSNISTLYAHLSAISVIKGQSVNRGSSIGLSGRTGYATGPHLHFSVLVTKASEIKTIVSKVCGRNMILPFAGSDPVSGIEGYLNPMDYL